MNPDSEEERLFPLSWWLATLGLAAVFVAVAFFMVRAGF